MTTSASRRLVAFSAIVILASLSGCAETLMVGERVLWPPRAQVSDHVPGITPPYERMKSLRGLAGEARSMPGERQQQVSAELAAQYQQEADPLIRLEMLRTLAQFPTEPASGVLRTAMSDSDPDVRVVACELWGKRGGADATAVLVEALSRDSSADVRLAAARALGVTGDSAATTALGAALDDPDPAMQVRAVNSLRQVTGKDFGGDVDRWRQYVKGEPPAPAKPVSLADRVRNMF
ncbi:MAG: HEAT repeat domain-containing protein [Pirellulales bacterium]|nr:HEAT repeat domain-containing protein [Pirellulales bacterium]